MEPRRSFRFFKELSEGAFGKVYLAEMITGDNFKSVVAIKLLHGKWTDHEEIVQRSRDEARVLGLLHHRNIIRVEDLTSINGQCAIVMEYLDGVDLKNLVNHTAERGSIIPRKVIFDVGAQIASALEAAYFHRPLQGGEPLNLIHRDIKPSNVMLTRAGDVKVLDFGTAQARFDHREAHTQALAFGSAAYMAPERLAGDPDAPTGDTFSLGITLYELLALKSFGKIHLRPEKFDAKLERRIAELPLDTVTPEIAQQIRLTLRALLHYDADERPTSSETVELLESLAESIHDGSMRRYCREIVAPLRDTMEPEQDPNDRLTGSTLYEDISGFNAIHEGEPDTMDLLKSSRTWVGDEDFVQAELEQSAPAAAPPAEPAADASSQGPAVEIEEDEDQAWGAQPAAPASAEPAPALPPASAQSAPVDGDEDEADPTLIASPDEVRAVLAAARGESPADDGIEITPVAPDPVAPDPVAPSPTPVAPDPASVGAPALHPAAEPLHTPGLEHIDLPKGRFSGPGTLDSAAVADPSAIGPDAGPITAPTDGPIDPNLFSAPTIHRAPLDDDDPFDEYGDDAPATVPTQPPVPPPSVSPPVASPASAGPAPVPAGITATAVVHEAPPAAAPAPATGGSGGVGKLIALAAVVLVVLGGGAFGVSQVIGGGAGSASDPPPSSAGNTETPARSGGTVEVAPLDANHGALRLKVPEGTKLVEVFSSTSEAEYRWDGTGELLLNGIEAGKWRTKVQPKRGRTARGVLEVVGDQTCSFAFFAEEWVPQGCE